MARLKVDESLPRPVVPLLRGAGHDAVSVHEQGMGGWKDDPLALACRRENRVVLTTDRRFADPRRHPTRGTPGIVVLRPPAQGRDMILDYVRHRLLPLLVTDSPVSVLWIVEPHRLRIHRDPR